MPTPVTNLFDARERGTLYRLCFPPVPDSAPVRYAVAFGCCAVAFVLTILLDPLLHERAIPLLFTLAVAASGIRGGFGPGLFATFLGAFGGVYFCAQKLTFFTIARDYRPFATDEWITFIAVGIILSWLGGELCQLRWQAVSLALQREHILESITDGFAALDANGRFLYLNTTAARLLKRSGGHEIAESLWEEVPHLRGSLLEKMFRQVVDRRTAVHFELQSPLSKRWFEVRAHPAENGGLTAYFSDISERKLTELQLLNTLAERDAALDRVQLLSGLLPTCAACKKIRDVDGNWHEMESYISDHSEAKFSHGMCPDCGKRYYGADLWLQTAESDQRAGREKMNGVGS